MRMKLKSSLLKHWGLLIPFLFSIQVYSQVETVPAEHPVYSFLKQMQVKGILKDYDDVVLPLSRKLVITDLLKIDSSKKNLTQTEIQFLFRMKEKFGLNNSGDNGSTGLFDDFPSELKNNLTRDSEKHLYSYKDSVISFFVDPILEGKYIYSSSYKNNSALLNFGGTIRGSYDNWLGYNLSGTNGAVFGNRETARLDQRVKQSFTFNHTGINYFDETSGYIRLQKGIVSFELGRDRILWGNGYIDRTILSDNPPLFDFIRFDIAYKKFRYDFLHGWLVQPAVYTFIDSLAGFERSKQPKYIAVSRLGYQANENLSFGVTQMIIYSGRPFEAAYLNPFLFWESAQRSMNDLDNSFLTFDGRYHIVNGLEASSSIIFDDINFSYLFKEEWAKYNNGEEWQAGIMLTEPIMPEDMTLKVEYLQIRPYTFSHPGGGESLTYTNNGYMLGTDLQPNSARLSAEFEYRLSSRLDLNLLCSHSLHGDNIYDASGSLVRNVGGNVFENFASAYDSQFAYLLDGNREVNDKLSIDLSYEIIYGYYFDFTYQYYRSSFNGTAANDNVLITSFKVNFE
jgi:hypothetical protein